MKQVFAVSLCLVQAFAGWGQERTVLTLKEGWKFKKGEIPGAEQPDLNDASWESLSIPHDWAISGPFIIDGNGSTGKLPWKGQAWYRNTLDIPASYDGKSIYLIFDGVMAFPKIYLNGKLIGEWDYGYNSFYVDISDHLVAGSKNVLAVHADTRAHDSRWYPGAGIYRKVQMLVLDPVHVDIWGTFVTTPIIKPNYADVQIRTTLNNHSSSSETIDLIHELLSPDGQIIARDTVSSLIAAGKQRELESTMTVIDPGRWDLNDPALHKIVSKVMVKGELRDQYETKFGIRSIRMDADHGFYLNDRRVQLYGVNLHHDHGPIGAAFYTRALERQLEIMKGMGVNAIRNSHNTAAPELAELCDRMGLLFFNEIFDKYDAKAGITAETDFDEFAHRNICNFIKRDRNSPSVFLWSVGNEIGDVQNNINNGFHRLHTMLNYVNKYDPTRPTTLVCDNQESAKLRHFDYYDVHSWNYGRRYSLARQIEPNKPVLISESASTLSTRGFYEFPLPKEKTDFTKSLQVSSYDLNAPWWAEIADDDFMWQQEEAYVIGEFVWTGFDYLGEPTPYDNKTVLDMGFTDKAAARSSYFGIVDLVGIPKDRYYLYKSYWKPEDTTIHILPHWNWPERVGQNVPVFVYTNGDCAELFLNGKSLGTRCKNPKSENSVDRFRLMWKDVIYQPGKLEVVAYKKGKLLGKKSLLTTSEAKHLKLTPDRLKIKSGGDDLVYIHIDAVDERGDIHPLADHGVKIEIQGPGKILGVGNGNPQSFKPFQANTVDLFYGRAIVILQSGNKKGTIKVAVSAKGLSTQQLEIRVD